MTPMISMIQWRLLDSGASSGARNMALDEAILAELEAGRSPPTVRVYGWNPPCITLGHSQRPETELDLPKVREQGFHVAMRATGGRAVLHVDELAYSVIAPADATAWCGSQSQSYQFISQALASALTGEGFGVALDRGYPTEKPAAMRAMTPCFSSTARSEVVWNGKKVVGSAQRRRRDCFLQHGSILVADAHRLIVRCLNLNEEKHARYLEILDANSVSLERIAGQPLDWRALADGFLPRFAEALGIAYRMGECTEQESVLAGTLELAKLRFQEELWSGVAKASGASMTREAVHA